jgi:hypothetical protein
MFDAAVRGYSVKLTCRQCGHVRIFSSHGLWWLFRQKGWPDRLNDVRRRCVCDICRTRRKEIIRNPRLELVHQETTGFALRMPPEREWKRELSRRR